MISSNLYVIRNPYIIQERIQPVYSQFILQYDDIDFPIFVNDIAAEILRLCDGTKSIAEIYKILSERYNEPISEIESKLVDFWDMSAKCNHIQFSDLPVKVAQKLDLFGSRDYWTPDLVSVELTHNCPLKCRHCFLSAGKGDTMQLSTWNSIASGIIDMHIPQVQLTGGEPLLHPAFFDILGELLINNITVHVFTSGVVFSDVIFEKINTYSDRFLKKLLFQVSIDGLADYHDEFRGVPGSFNRSIHFIKEIVKYGFKTSVGVTVSNQSFDELDKLCKLCKNIGVSVVRIGGITNRGRAEDNGISSQAEEIINIISAKNQIAAELNSDTFKVLFNEESNDTSSRQYVMTSTL